MLAPTNIFSPYILGPGLNMSVSSGTILTSVGVVSSPTTIIALQPNVTNFVYFNVSSGVLQSNTSAFPGTNALPISTVRTSGVGIISLLDNRPDLIFVTSGGGGGSADTVQSLSTSQTISFGGAVNLFIEATAGVGGISLALPSAAALTGQKACIKKIDSAVGFVTMTGGAESAVLGNQNQYVTFESDGASWYIVANN